MHLQNTLPVLLLFVLLSACNQNKTKTKERLPNILVVMTDDMGYGDPKCFNPDSKIHTPHIDQLAANGMRFTNAHAPGTTCVPSRYGLLTGRYPWRNSRTTKIGVIEPGMETLASRLKKAGYTTAVVGKWHQGMIDEKQPQPGVVLERNPGEYGFDSHFIMPASLDIPPYYYVRNGLCVEPPTDTIAANNTPGISPIQGAFWRKGGIAPNFKMEQVVDRLTEEAESVIGDHFEDSGKPLFLYFALPSPHTPWLPSEAYKGKTMAGDYGDYTSQTDGALGAVIAQLKKAGQLENTLVVFTSDNGPVWYPEDIEKYGHSSTGKLRGMKGDTWEGGHRMPFVVQWPDQVKPNSENHHLICFTDLLATVAEITGTENQGGLSADSFSLLHQLTGVPTTMPERKELVLKGMRKGSYFVISEGWKYIDYPGSGGFSARYGRQDDPNAPPVQLYDLQNDLGETQNLFAEHPEKANALSELLKQTVNDTLTKTR
ncbi:MAG: arylsulfatase [Bacteroidota bacterium]